MGRSTSTAMLPNTRDKLCGAETARRPFRPELRRDGCGCGVRRRGGRERSEAVAPLILPAQALRREHPRYRAHLRRGVLILGDGRSRRGHHRRQRCRGSWGVRFELDDAVDEESVLLKGERPWRRRVHKVSGDVEEEEKREKMTWTPTRNHSDRNSSSTIDRRPRRLMGHATPRHSGRTGLRPGSSRGARFVERASPFPSDWPNSAVYIANPLISWGKRLQNSSQVRV